MKLVWSKKTTRPVNKQAAFALSYESRSPTNKELVEAARERLIKSPRRKERARVRTLVSLIGSENARLHGLHDKGGVYANKRLRRGMSQEELIWLLLKFQHDPKYGARVREFLAKTVERRSNAT